jgi:hypothetical protein
MWYDRFNTNKLIKKTEQEKKEYQDFTKRAENTKENITILKAQVQEQKKKEKETAKEQQQKKNKKMILSQQEYKIKKLELQLNHEKQKLNLIKEVF